MAAPLPHACIQTQIGLWLLLFFLIAFVLATLFFDFNVHHPYKPLVEAIKKFKVAQNALAQVA